MGFSIGDYLQIGSTLIGGLYSMNMQTKQYIAQVKAQSKKFNYDIQALRMQRRDLYEQVVDEMTKVRMNQHRLTSSVQAGLNENFENGGRTVRALERSLQGDEDRAIFSIREGYNKGVQQLNYQTNLAIVNTKNAINSIQKPNNKLNAFNTFLVAQGIENNVNNREAALKLEGYTTDIHGRIVPLPELQTAADKTTATLNASNFSLGVTKDWLGITANKATASNKNDFSLGIIKDWLGINQEVGTFDNQFDKYLRGI